jgi:hypothetical protein
LKIDDSGFSEYLGGHVIDSPALWREHIGFHMVAEGGIQNRMSGSAGNSLIKLDIRRF